MENTDETKTELTAKTFGDLLLGVAIGDAFGAGLEFQDRNWILQHVDFTRFQNERNDVPMFINSKGISEAGYKDWEYTDDTEMTLGCIKAIISGKALSENLLQEYWVKEFESDKARKGYGRHGHGSMRWVYSGEKTFAEVQEFQRHRPNPGNGAVMRILPFAFLPESEIDRMCILNSNATHPNDRSSAACILVARTCNYLVRKNGDAKSLIEYLLPFISALDTEMYLRLEKIQHFSFPDALTNEEFEILCGQQPIVKPWYPEGLIGLPSDAMYTALCVVYLLKHYRSAMDGLKASIRFGGDVDSLASVVTGILAAKYGLDSIPAFMKENVEGKEQLNSIAAQWYQHYNSSKSDNKAS